MPEQMQNQNAEYISLNNFMTFETVGDVIEGTYMGWTMLQTEQQTYRQHMIMNASGIWKFNSTTQLEQLIVMPSGVNIRIEYIGTVKGNQRVKQFDIKMKAADFQELLSRGFNGQPAIEAPIVSD